MAKAKQVFAKQIGAWRNVIKRQKHIDCGLTDAEVEGKYFSAIMQFASYYVPDGLDTKKLFFSAESMGSQGSLSLLDKFRGDVSEWLAWEHAYVRRGYRSAEPRGKLSDVGKVRQDVQVQLNQKRGVGETPVFYARKALRHLEETMAFFDVYYD